MKILMLAATILLLSCCSSQRPEKKDQANVLVYWAVASKDLQEYSKPYLFQFEQIASNPQLNIFLSYSHLGNKPTEIYKIAYSDKYLPHQELAYSQLLKKKKRLNAADPKNLKDFVQETLDQQNSNFNVLVIGAHGSNWSGLILDEKTDSYMELDQLGLALKEITKQHSLDLVVFDACKMSFLETLLALEGKVHYMVGSPLDVNGFDHQQVWTNTSQHFSVQELGKNYVKSYTNFFPNRDGDWYAASFLQSDGATLVAQQFDRLVQAYPALLSKQLALASTKNEDGDKAYDFIDVLEKISQQSGTWSGQANSIAENAKKLVLAADSNGNKLSGLSITCPNDTKAYLKTSAGLQLEHWATFCHRL